MSNELEIGEPIEVATNQAVDERSANWYSTSSKELSVSTEDKEKVGNRFWEKVDRPTDDACWLWKKGRKEKGYGRFEYKGKTVHAHRMAFALTKGAIPGGMSVLHRCDVRNCCNPAHLFLGTNDENIKDMVSKGRHPRGERHGKSKLTAQAVAEIRERRGERLDALAQRHRVHTSTVARARNAETWKDTRIGQSERPGVYPLPAKVAAISAVSAAVDVHQGGVTLYETTFDDSRVLDVHQWTEAPWVRDLATYLYFDLFGECQGRRAHRRWRHLVIILIDLFMRNDELPGGYLGVSLNRNSYRSDRYNKLRVAYRPTRQVITRLVEAGYIEFHNGFLDRETKIGRQARIRSTPALLDLFREFDGVLDDPDDCEYHREAIVLKDEAKRKIDYTDCELTNKYREFVDQVNDALRKSDIDLDRSRIDLKHLPNVHRKRVWRVFNNRRWDLGGRFHGPWWMSANSDEMRPFIVINGLKTAELDYAGIHIWLLYSRKGLVYPGGDPYDLQSDFGALWCKGLRKLAKLSLLILINARTRSAALRAIRQEARKRSVTKPFVDQLGQVVNALLTKHQAIQEYFFSGEGLSLQFEDAQIAERVMRTFLERQTPILSIHDSFIVQEAFSELLRDTMISEARLYVQEKYGIEVTVEVK